LKINFTRKKIRATAVPINTMSKSSLGLVAQKTNQ
jgi:hypothetical protein